MYDDLARTQRRSVLELFVARCLIPSLLTSFVVHCQAIIASGDGTQYEFNDCFGETRMSAISSAASVSIHVAVAAALLLGTTRSGRTDPITLPRVRPLVFVDPGDRVVASLSGAPVKRAIAPVDLSSIPIPADVLQGGALGRTTFSPAWAPGTREGSSAVGGGGAFAETGPEALSGPLPAYPELLRQAGIEGQVVLEARVDSTGRVERGSIVVVSASHPGFVAPARQALMATLFRPARVNGRPVSTLVRVPFAFSIRGGTGRAR